MLRARVLVLFLVFALSAVLVVPLGGCDGTDADSDDDTTTSEVSDQDGLETGTAAPDFRMQNQDQMTVALKDYLGTKNVVLVFYPADFTPV